MKKIMIVGGGIRQVQLLDAAKKLNYHVVLCDMTTECPGYKYADTYYSTSTMDYEALLDVAKKEKVDGIITNSEPAMPIVTRIANDLGLVGNLDVVKQIQGFAKASWCLLSETFCCIFVE